MIWLLCFLCGLYMFDWFIPISLECYCCSVSSVLASVLFSTSLLLRYFSHLFYFSHPTIFTWLPKSNPHADCGVARRLFTPTRYSSSCFHPVLLLFLFFPPFIPPCILLLLFSLPAPDLTSVHSKAPPSCQAPIETLSPILCLKKTHTTSLCQPSLFFFLSFFRLYSLLFMHHFTAMVHPMCILAWSVTAPEITQTALIKWMRNTHMRIISVSRETVNW